MGARPEVRLRRKRQKEARRSARERDRRGPARGESTHRAAVTHLPLGALTWPVVECCLEATWREPGGLVRVAVARRVPGGRTAIAVFLIDKGCLGAKNGFTTLVEPGTYARVRDRIFDGEDPERCDLALASEIVRGGIRYAASLGFEPHPDARAALPLLGPEVPCDVCVRFGGTDGKPLYVAGPDDDAPRILRTLSERLGPEGFHFVVPGVAGEWSEVLGDVEDARAGSDDVEDARIP